MKKLLIATLLFYTTYNSFAIINKSEQELLSKEIKDGKAYYQNQAPSPERVREIVKEKRKERNAKVKNVVEIARKSDLPAGWFLRSISDGKIDQTLLQENKREYKARIERDNAKDAPFLPIPVKLAIVVAIFSLFGIAWLKIKKAIQNI